MIKLFIVNKLHKTVEVVNYDISFEYALFFEFLETIFY